MLKIAHYYYRDHLTQAQIAEKLSISRLKVHRMLKRLLAEGLVKIEISDYLFENIEIEHRLESVFNLRAAVVISGDNDEMLSKKLGAAAADFLDTYLQPNMRVAFGWGETLWHMVDNLKKRPERAIEVVQVAGSLKGTNGDDSIRQSIFYTDSLAVSFAQKMGGVPILFHATVFVENKETKKALIEEQFMKENFAMIESCDAAILGTSGLSLNATPFKEGFLESKDFQYLKDHNVVGHIVFNFIDEYGRRIPALFDERTIIPSLSQLRKIPVLIVVGGGEEKQRVMLANIRAKMVDVLVTDTQTAQFLLERAEAKG
jgi:DNA-binding transcriptional regulator LsrR (DeoR family)